MEIIKLILACIFGLTGLVAWIIILIEAFKDELWKGIVSLLCNPYLLWFAIFDFDHEHKWLLVLLAFGGSGIAAGIMRL